MDKNLINKKRKETAKERLFLMKSKLNQESFLNDRDQEKILKE